MKKMTALLMLTAATSLAACSHRGDYGYNNGYNNGNYDNGYQSSYHNNFNGDQNYAEQNYNGSEDYNNNNRHNDWRSRKANMMVDELFNKCDANRDGFISAKEYKTCAYRMFRASDMNHDGKLSRSEVYRHMLHKMNRMHREMDRDNTTSYNNTSYSNTYASGNGTNSYRDERAYQDMTPAAGEDSEGFNNNAYSHDAGNVNRYNETH